MSQQLSAFLKPVWALVLTLLCLLAFTCQRKTVEIDLVETACKNFNISSPAFTRVIDPTCNGNSQNARLRIACKHSGKAECIKRINLKAKFYDAANVQINSVSFPETLLAGDPLVTITKDSLVFFFDYTFDSGTDPRTLNFLYLNFQTENDYGDLSKKLQLRVNSNCGVLHPSTYKVVDSVRVNSSLVNITLWDDAKEDGDIVSVWLNDRPVLENYTLTNAGRTFQFSISGSDNKLVLFAVNEGTEGPNTLAISVNSGKQINLHPSLLTGQAINIRF